MLFITLYDKYATGAFSLLFGTITGVSVGQVLLLGGCGIGVVLGLGLIYRPLLFASVDPTLDHLRREERAWVERVSERKRALKDVVYACEATLRESRSLVARSCGKPYLIAENGELTIRGFDQLQSAAK